MVTSFFYKVLNYMLETKSSFDEAFDKFFPEFEIAIKEEVDRELIAEVKTKE